MEKDEFVAMLQQNNPESMMEYLLNNGKKPKPFNPIRFLTQQEMEELKNGTNNERINERD